MPKGIGYGKGTMKKKSKNMKKGGVVYKGVGAKGKGKGMMKRSARSK